MKLINEAVAILRVQSNDLEAVAARYRAADEFGAANKVIRTAAYIDYAATLLAESEAVLEVFGSAGQEEYDIVSSKFHPKAAEPIFIDDLAAVQEQAIEAVVAKYVAATEFPSDDSLVGLTVVLHPGFPYENFEGSTGVVKDQFSDKTGGYEFVVTIDGEEFAFHRSEFEVLVEERLSGNELVGRKVRLTKPDVPGFDSFIGEVFTVKNYTLDEFWSLEGKYPYLVKSDDSGAVLSMNVSEFEVL